MKPSLFRKIWLSNALLIVVMVTILTTAVFVSWREHYISLKKEHLGTALEGLRGETQWRLSNYSIQRTARGDKDELQSWVRNTGKRMGIRITIIDQSGLVLADSQESPGAMENHGDRPEFKSALKVGTGSSIRYSYTLQTPMIYLAISVLPDSLSGSYILRGSHYLSDIDKILNNLKYKILVFILLLLGISLSFSALLTKNITAPIKELLMAVDSAAKGKFRVQRHHKGNDEISSLSSNLRSMVEKVEATIRTTVESREELNNLISAVHSAILLIDMEGRIQVANKSFIDLINGNEIEGRFYWEAIRLGQLNSIIRERLEKKDETNSNIDYRKKVYRINAKYLPDTNHVLAVLDDVTEFRKLEQVKKDLIANASHELRTPLTVIKGYIEAIHESNSEDRKKFLSIIERHTERLISMVNDLLSLSRLEDSDYKSDLEEVNLSELVLQICSSFEEMVKTKGLELKKEISDNVYLQDGNRFELEQLTMNLIENAIKYTETGYIKVGVMLSPGEFVELSVVDTGIGIDHRLQSRIFERFYVVDPSRSKEQGGTGLGLSIVKHIAQKMNATIRLDSQLDLGTSFFIRFQIKPTLAASHELNRQK